ncbi:MAG: hypothetical protein M1823_003097 [Watsoniomyces obsoletus]|nr:MAG: hypothetical protein M1823_003097 [Watsoniomyces obsoletus]
MSSRSVNQELEAYAADFRREFDIPEPHPDDPRYKPSPSPTRLNEIVPARRLTRRPLRKVQMLWEDLRSLGSAASSLHSSNHGTTGSNSPYRIPQMPWSKGHVDEDGPYVVDASPKVAHWALRVEREPGNGDWKDESSWQYYGLRQTNNICYLDTKSFRCPDGRDRLWDTWTEFDLAGIETCAQHLTDEAGEYKLFGNNCQNFTANLLTLIISRACPTDLLTEMLWERTLITRERWEDLTTPQQLLLGVPHHLEGGKVEEGRLVSGTELEVNALMTSLYAIYVRIGWVKQPPKLPLLDTDDVKRIRDAHEKDFGS